MKQHILLLFIVTLAYAAHAQPSPEHDLRFNKLATVWDEGIPLGNATLGALVWQKNGELRFALDRSDLWDIRPMKGLDIAKYNYAWIAEHVKKKDYKPVQQQMDEPYEKEPAPSKIPGAALMIDTKKWGEVKSVHLNIATALCTIKWNSGIVLETFVHANEPKGWYRITNLKGKFNPRIDPPPYESKVKSGAGSVEGDDLNRLGYTNGRLTKSGNKTSYYQEGWNGFNYTVVTEHLHKGNVIEGKWTIFTYKNDNPFKTSADTYIKAFTSHKVWWKNFWSKSSLRVPDRLLEKQWYLEMYKFGSTARSDAPPISLQAIWTADNGRLPPWKGDFHHDLNTQLSYWPSYSGNHLEEAMGYLRHLDNNKSNYKRYTNAFFGVEGLNVPGVTTLDGTEMGGWIQYSGSPTISSWLAQHFYLQWRYSLDTALLKASVYPWFAETATFIERITVKDKNGLRQLPLSSSPEIYNNNIEAWFTENTNYDLALMKYVIVKAAELATIVDKNSEADQWKKLLSEFGDFSVTSNDELMFAPGKPYNESHRHFSNMMAIHPLALIKWEDGENARNIIRNSIKALDSVGPAWWCGYSYSWLGNLKARAKDGAGAAKALQTFANAFCSVNSFHVNGDQTKSGLSNFTYRPFTLEGNFAFAAGVQEMLLQSYAGFIELFPALPAHWKNVSFKTLRAEGAFLVTAVMGNKVIKEVTISSEKGGKALVKIPFKDYRASNKRSVKKISQAADFIEIVFEKGGSVTLKR